MEKTWSLFMFVVVVILLLSTQLVSAATIFTATLTGDQEVPPVMTEASGVASLVLNDAQTRLEINIEILGLDLDGLQTPSNPADDVVGAHIHRGAFGTNGPVVFGFISPDSDLNGDLLIDPVAGTIFSGWDLNEGNGTTLSAEIASLLNGDLYFNVHTNTVRSGEIRGQINVVPIPGTLLLFGSGLLGFVGLRRKFKNK
jgi:hypothetical protein